MDDTEWLVAQALEKAIAYIDYCSTSQGKSNCQIRFYLLAFCVTFFRKRNSDSIG